MKALVENSQNTPIYTKLQIGAENDAYEKEADAVAEQVVQMKVPDQPAAGGASFREEERLRRMPLINFIQAKGEEGGTVAPDSVSSILSKTNDSGNRLDENTQTFMESRFNADFSDVKIHTGHDAVFMNRQLNARAFTTGNNIYFNSGMYDPGSNDGKKLLAHELTHTIQQGNTTGAVQKKPGPQENVKQTYGDDFVIFEDELLNYSASGKYAGILLRGDVKIEILNLPPDKAELFKPKDIGTPQKREPAEDEMIIDGQIIKLPPLPEPKEKPGIKITSSQKAIVLRVTRHITIHTNSGVDARVVLVAETTLSKRVEIKEKTPKEIVDHLFNYPFGTANISILFNGKFPGDPYPHSADPVNDQQVTSLNDIIRSYAPDLVGYNFGAQQQYDAAINLFLAYVPYTAIAIDDPRRKIVSKDYKTLDDAKKAAAKMGKKDILIVQSQDGKFHVYELTQKELMLLATELRNNEEADSKIDWHTSPNKEKVEKLYINGNEVNLTDYVNNFYYVDADSGATGRGKANTEKEVIVYKMKNSGFYARKPISHDDAMGLWKTIDEKIEFAENISKAYKLHDGVFVSLVVKGVGEYHTIDADYIEGKRIFIKNVDEYNRDVTVENTQTKETYSPLSFDIYAKSSGPNLLKYIEAQLDRGYGQDDVFREKIKDKKYLLDSLSLVVHTKLYNEGRRMALDVLTKLSASLKAMASSDDAMRNLILSMSKMDAKERKDVLSMMGVKEEYKDIYSSILSDPKVTAQIAFGIPVKTISFQALRSGMQTVVTDTDKIINQINKGDIDALRLEGDFGILIRDEVYKKNEFTRITGKNYPHHDQTSGTFPEPLSGKGSDFSGIREQMYANYVAHSDNASFLLKIGAITLMAIVTAGIVIFSGGVGAGVAAAFFEAGTAAFIATEVVVTAATMTILTEGLNQALGQGALGKDKAYFGFGDLAISFGENLLLSSIFAGVGRIMKNAAAVWRLSATGSLFLGYSLGKYYYQNKKFPHGRDLYLFIYENLITLAAIEAGSVLARPLTNMFYAKGLDVRVERINKNITVLKADINITQKKLADIVASGKMEKNDLLSILSEQRVLLERQQKILQELKDSKTLSTDIHIDSELNQVNEALEKIRVAEFQAKIDFRQNQFASEKIGYKQGKASVDEIINFYGKENVTGPDKDGIMQVKLKYGGELEFYPENMESQVNKKILERPAAKLDAKTSFSIDVAWKNFDNIPGIKIFKGNAPVVTARDFYHEKGADLYDIVYEGKYYVKYDAKNGRLLIGDVQSQEIIGFYVDDARNFPGLPHSDILVKDPVHDIPGAVEKLKTYHGLAGTGLPLKGNFSSKAKIVANPDKTTTILGAFIVKDGKVIYTDMPQLFDNFGNLKNADFGAKKGGFNVLNVGEGFYEPGAFFENYNRPWLEEAIRRGDDFYAASDPLNEIFIFEKNKTTGDWVYTTDQNTGVKSRKRTGFGKEVQILEQNGYKYDPATGMYKK